ncbi:5' nucleotidase, NT5C type [Erwinia amylovora]|uniref:Uncharacterized protein n=5 Tax=Erwinia amylovora TaxID=552 RepID=A0A831A2Z5_ERWAM|nr:5'-3'-deoxyribonucleotidase [Erwinia amylovora]CBX80116.1 hypothetical protein EAIL5_1296 [Erwinia amylovora ATCC BAA-2158]CDK14796.1 hypothetical protein LA635_1172 [Erwinia amylovora LA635]CDK18164.1 hypothetical protein LA636_1172 [Erwinia amylovora LA636]CDK21533.1 hypothetical protein LA637_1173 [Erwinia amylovora LA637]ATZ11122.1 5'-3'-deoxyribonucleotidase [Erwinia amylovora]
MKRIAIDMDEVIADFHPKILATWNNHFTRQLSAEELNLFDLHRDSPQQLAELFALVDHPTFFDDLAVIADSQQVIARLSEHYEIFITTAAMLMPSSFNAKFRWLNAHFPAIPHSNIVFCGDKSIIKADYMIDDNAINFANFGGEGILYSAPHNRKVTGYRRAENWQDIATLLL